jgi:Skp family chaperone for outer membrane proteins
MKKTLIISIILMLMSFSLFAQGSMAESSDPQELMKSIYLTDNRLSEIGESYARLWTAEKQRIEDSFATELNEIEAMEPEIWETDAEFDKRVKTRRQSVEKNMQELLTQSRAELEAERRERLKFYTHFRQTAEQNLTGTRELGPSQLQVKALPYQRNERIWPLTISSSNPVISFSDLEFTVDFQQLVDRQGSLTEAVKQEIIDFDQAVQSGRLSAEASWSVFEDDENRYVSELYKVTVTNGVNGKKYRVSYPYTLAASARTVVEQPSGQTRVVPTSVITDILFTQKLSVSPGKTISPGFEIVPSHALNKDLKFSIKDPAMAEVDQEAVITASDELGTTQLIVTSEDGLFNKSYPLTIEYRVGDIGPGGGVIFYDSGSYSRGWRFLEAAPEDIYIWPNDDQEEIAWGGEHESVYQYIRDDVRTSAAIGSGLENTERIADYIASKANAAQLALDYNSGGFEDWFLPSKNELNAMITTFNELFGDNEAPMKGYSYWSSSLDRDAGFLQYAKAWEQFVHNEQQRSSEIIYTTSAIRAVRRF